MESQTGYLRPKSPRRDYYSQEPKRSGHPEPVVPRPGAVPTVAEAINGLLQAHATDWSITTLRNARHYLLLNRFPAYCAEKQILTIDQLTTGHIEEFLAGLSRILKAETLVKYRTYLRALARFCAETPGYPAPGLADVERLPVPRIARRKLPIALTKEQEATVLETAGDSGRDRLIVETLLACGLRVSELCALLVSDLVLDHRPPYIHVRGSVYDRDLTKSEEDRNVPFRAKYATLPSRLREYVASERDTKAARGHQEVFLSERTDGDGRRHPLTPGGVQQLMERIAGRTGFHCNPHKLRHTWATRCVDAGIPMFHLQQAGGWKSIEMVRRYYSANAKEMLQAFQRAHED